MRDELRLIVALIACGWLLVVSFPSPRARSDDSGGRGVGAGGRPVTSAGADAGLLGAGQTLDLKVREVVPCDSLSPGERVLNSRPPLMAGDRFVAEVLRGGVPCGILLGGTITQIHPPGTFRRPGHLEITLLELVATDEKYPVPRAVSIDMNDRRWSTLMKRQMLSLLLEFEGAGIGAALGAQLAQSNPVLIGSGAGIGLLAAVAYIGVQHGAEATLQPGDTFQVVVGKCSYRPLPATTPFTIYAPDLPARK